ncbi:MAG: hypothetical protein ABW033_01865 [Acidimicrobiia bacterium]
MQCSATATARVAFDALACFVWIDPFEADGPRDVSARGAGALCTRHADRLVPPRGWTVQDRRGREIQLWSERPVVDAPTPIAVTPPEAARSTARARASSPGASSGNSAPAIAVLEPVLPFADTDPADAATRDGDGRNADIEELLAAPSSPLLSRAFNAAHSRQAG